MSRRYIHYEAAFEDYVRSLGWPYIPVDEQRKAIFGGSRIKSFDFLVYGPEPTAWLADIKGRKFPYESGGSLRYWENWVTAEDLDALASWGSVFGEQFAPVLIFAYWLLSPDGRLPSLSVHTFRGESYSFFWIPAAVYAAHARRRSDRWDTLSMPTAEFRRLARPVDRVPFSAIARPSPAERGTVAKPGKADVA